MRAKSVGFWVQLLSIFLLMLVYQNCEYNSVVFTSESTSPSTLAYSGGGNGSGHDGKPSRYYFQYDADYCLSKNAHSSGLKSMIRFEGQKIDLVIDDCDDISPLPLAASQVSMSLDSLVIVYNHELFEYMNGTPQEFLQSPRHSHNVFRRAR